MHAYLITAKPGPFRRAFAMAVHVVAVVVALVVMVVLGVIAFAFRCIRPIANYLAANALYLELWAADRTGLPPVSSIVGAGLTAEFMNEFRKGWDTPAAEHERTHTA